MKIETSQTAISRGGKLSAPVKLLLDKGLLTSAMGFFDWGHGLGEDMVALKQDHGFKFVAGYDPNFYVQGYSVDEVPEATTSAFRNVFEWVYCGYVLNVIPSERARNITLERIHDFMLDGRQLCVAVRSKKEVEYNVNGLWQAYEDGWVTSKHTFQKGFEPGELAVLLAKKGFTNIDILSKNPLIVTARKAGKMEDDNGWTEAFLDNFED